MKWHELVSFYSLLLAIGVSGGLGDICIYRWAKQDHWVWLSYGLASWLSCLLLFGMAIRWWDRSLSVTFVLSAIVHIAVVLGWDFLVGKVKLTALEYAGLVFAIIGILCLEFGQQLHPAGD